jgi:hypothetical protein
MIVAVWRARKCGRDRRVLVKDLIHCWKREGKGDPENATCFEKYEQSGP